MNDNLLKLLNSVQNPETNKSLTEESRWSSVEEKDEQIWVSYKRDGISSQNKKIIEESIKTALSSFDRKKIFVMTTSQEEKPATQEKKVKPAGLSVGHSKPAPQRVVNGVEKIIAIGSGKGGVGKSTFTINLACSLAKEGYKVGVLDADIYGPSLPKLLGKEEEQASSNSDKKIIPVEAHGIKFISFGLFINHEDAVIWRGPMLGGVISQFLFDVDWSGLDYLFIDLPPGTGDVQLSLIQATQLDGAINISTPQDVALLDSVRGYEMFKKLNIEKLCFVENMSHFICDGCGKEHSIFGNGGVEQRAKELGVQFLGQIPLETSVRECSDNGRPFMSQDQFSKRSVWKSYKEVSKNFLEYFPLDGDKKKKGLLNRIFSR